MKDRMPIQAINPATEEVINTYEELSNAETDAVVRDVYDASISWRDVSFDERAKYMNRAADVLEEKKTGWAEIITREMGKPILQAVAEIEKCAWVCRYYSEHAGRFLADETVHTDAHKSYVRNEPLGVVLAVMPWNFPFWQVFRFAAPALMAGNTGLLKHASNVPGSSLAIEEIFREAGFPDNIFQSLIIPAQATERVITNPLISAVTLTGSGSAGSAVASLAGSALKKTVLELGGSDPFIVLEDADMEQSSSAAAQSRLGNCGQSCIAAKRFIVIASRYDEFIEKLVSQFEHMVVGDPLDKKTQVGPLARKDLRAVLAQQVQKTIDSGGRRITGGKVVHGKGYFYEPTIIVDVTEDMPLYSEETFGPVAAVIKALNEDDAVRIANDTTFGLGASVWTNDRDRGEHLAMRIEAGTVFVNGLVKSDPRLPFGGIKQSGYGRELGVHGIQEFVNKKTVWIG